jgi:gliding motility-associated-like protein
MKYPLTLLCSFLFLPWMARFAAAQDDNPYILNGGAYQENCNCYTLTPDAFFVSGSLWNKNKIDLNQPFDYKFNVFLGCTDDQGADGIVFVLQPISTSIGSAGGGLGYEHVSPAVGITIDTWQNVENQDPFYDHIAIHLNGDINHNSPNNIAGPVEAIEGRDNIEDCEWHVFRIVWDPVTKNLKAAMDGKDRVAVTIDLVKKVFNGDPMVYWGFTGATGGAKNHQRVCTSLNPSFNIPDDQITCFPTPVIFNDNSTSFGSIVRWYWDFGDGKTDSISNPPPHVFPAPGVYNVNLRILGNNGCISDSFSKKLIIGSDPVAVFKVDPKIVCELADAHFIDSSYVQYGTINKWLWKVGNDEYPDGYKDIGAVPIHGAGDLPVSLYVTTREGCISPVTTRTITALPAPKIDFSFIEACVGNPARFEAINRETTLPIKQWAWDLGDTKTTNELSFSHNYSRGGKYAVQLKAEGMNGCMSETINKFVNIYQTNAFAGNDTIIARNQPLQLHASGGIYYSWSPGDGLNDPLIADPVATLQSDKRYVLTASTPQGCPSSDTINIKVYRGPELYVPTAFSPNGDGKNDQLTFIAAGMTSVDFFNVYNRYGQLVFHSTSMRQGWDGTLNGSVQSTGTYVWMIKGKAYTGETVFRKGTVTLVR